MTASAGEFRRARRIVEFNGHLVPMNPQLAQQFAALEFSLAATEQGGDRPFRQAWERNQNHAMLEAAKRRFPDDPTILQVFLDRDPGAADRESLARLLTELDPVVGAHYLAPVSPARKSEPLGELWEKLVGNDTTLDLEEAGQVAALFEQAGAPAFALSAQRVQVALRGFSVPADQQLWKRLLPRLLGDAADALLADVDAGRLNQVQLAYPPEPDAWPGLNPHLATMRHYDIAQATVLGRLFSEQDDWRVDALVRRAGALIDLGQFEPAAVDLDLAQTAKADDPAIAGTRALLALSKFEPAEALEVLAPLLADKKTRPRFLRTAGNAHFQRGEFKEAQACYDELPAKGEDGEYSAIFADIAARRTGARDTMALDRMWLQGSADTWSRSCIAYLSGRIDEKAWMAESWQGNEFEVAQHQCEAHFYAGEVALAAGDEATAIRHFEASVGTGVSAFIEYNLAAAELRRLKPESAPKPVTPAEKPADPHPKGDRPEDDLGVHWNLPA